MHETLLEKMAGEITLAAAPGPAIRKWRESFGVSQADLAARLKVGASVVSDHESGRRPSPGTATVRRIVEALAAIDESRGGHVLARYRALGDTAEGIVDLAEYRRNVPAREFVEAIEGRALVTADLDRRRVQGFTLIDSLKAIASLDSAGYVRLFGRSTERALVFTGVQFGRSPMIAVRVHPMKPSLVVYQRPADVDRLAHRLAELERIPLVTTDLDVPDLAARMRSLLA